MILSFLSYTSHGNNRNYDSWKPRFIWLLSFSLVFGLSCSLSAAASGGEGSDWLLVDWERPSSLSLVEDSVVSLLDHLGKKLNIDRSFLLRSAMTTYQQYCASDHVLSIHETQTLIGSPYPIRRHDIIGSCYPEHFCRCKYKYTVQYKNQQRRGLPNSGGIGDFSTSFFLFFFYYFLRHDDAKTYFFCAKIWKHAPLVQWRSLAWTLFMMT